MQMVMMVFRTSMEDEVTQWLEQQPISYTRIHNVEGKGATGHVPGAVAWGGSNTIVYAAIPDDQLTSFRDQTYEYWAQRFSAAHKKPQRTAKIPFHVFVFPCVQWI